MSVVLGTGTISVEQCLGLTRHSVLRLSEPAGEDVRLLVAGVPIARGEVVILDDRTAVRLTGILEPRTSEARR